MLIMEERSKAKPAREPLGSLPACLRARTESPEARCQIRRRDPGEEVFTRRANQEEVAAHTHTFRSKDTHRAGTHGEEGLVKMKKKKEKKQEERQMLYSKQGLNHRRDHLFNEYLRGCCGGGARRLRRLLRRVLRRAP